MRQTFWHRQCSRCACCAQYIRKNEKWSEVKNWPADTNTFWRQKRRTTVEFTSTLPIFSILLMELASLVITFSSKLQIIDISVSCTSNLGRSHRNCIFFILRLNCYYLLFLSKSRWWVLWYLSRKYVKYWFREQFCIFSRSFMKWKSKILY